MRGHSPAFFSHGGVTRREFIKRGVGLAAAGCLWQGCGAPVGVVRLADEDPLPNDPFQASPDGVIVGLGSAQTDPVETMRTVCAHLDWSWLTPGDRVFVKIACNSSFLHPAVTSPNAVRAIVAELLDRGASSVLVGDQGGIEEVRLAPDDRRFRSTRELAHSNGLIDAIVESSAEPHFFDEHGFDDGYYDVDPGDYASHWSEPLWIANVVREVDHIVYLPRLSSHWLTGYSLGHKGAVGWLRDDSRYDLHIDAAALHERYVEISHLPDIRDRLRLTITLAEGAFLDAGPSVGTLANLDGPVVIASPHLANHDAVGVAILSHLDRLMPEAAPIIRVPTSRFVLPFTGTYRPLLSDLQHRIFVAEFAEAVTGIPWGDGDMNRYTPLRMHDFSRGIDHDAALSRVYAIEGGVPGSIPVWLIGNRPRPGFLTALQTHDGGRLGMIV